MTNSTITSSVTTSPANVARNATKKEATRVAEIVVEFRKAGTASSAVSQVRRVVGQVLNTRTMSAEDRMTAITAGYEALKTQIVALVEQEAQAALELSQIPDGTTGPGGIHIADVKTEMFAAASKKTATENNSAALRKAGMAS
jgi:hypothetical protein